MPSSAKSASKKAVVISGLAAQVLGHSRTNPDKALSTQQVTAAFPRFNEMELANAMDELVEKRLLDQKGPEDRAVYTLTDHGRNSRVQVA